MEQTKACQNCGSKTGGQESAGTGTFLPLTPRQEMQKVFREYLSDLGKANETVVHLGTPATFEGFLYWLEYGVIEPRVNL